MLPVGGATLDGLYDFHWTPYWLGVAAALDDPAVSEVVLMKASQVGWTYFLLGYVFRRIDTDPCPIIVLGAKERDVKALHDEKLKPAAQATPAVAGVLDFSTSRQSGNRWDLKAFPGGFLKLVGSNSPGNVKSTSSVGVGIIEEPDDTAENVREQGDAIGHIEERVKRYPGSKVIVGGTPAVKGLSKTERRIQASDARVLPVRCHACGEKHVLDWDNVTWVGKDDAPQADKATGEITAQRHDVYGYAEPDTAVYVCPHCGEEWDDYRRQANIRDTVFQAVADGDPLCGWVPTKPFHGAAGFLELPELYACLPGSTLADVVRHYLEAEHLADQGDFNARITFVNQKLGRPYEFSGEQATEEQLREAARDYPELQVPDGGLLLTAGIDVQHDRVAVVIRAWGRGEESWLVYWGELYAHHTCVDKTDAVWDDLEKLVFGAIAHASGRTLAVEALTIDSGDGGTTDAVYHWVRTRARQHRHCLVMAGKGSSAQQDPEIFSTPRQRGIDHRNPRKATKADRHGVKVYLVGTNKAKDWIHGQLMLEAKGRGRFHYYAGVRDDYYDQLLSEVKAPHRTIRTRRVWQLKSGRRNEALDCEGNALHAARARRVHLMRPEQWDALEARLKQADLFSDRAEQPAPADAPPEKVTKAPPRRRGGFVHGWRK